MMNLRYRVCARHSMLPCVFLFASCAGAADAPYPNGPIRLIVPFASGGSTDVLARVMGQKLGE
jgi:tripartite-type tricarboxylate transporter receptor subunit TctC